jgi:hypothetical protein
MSNIGGEKREKLQKTDFKKFVGLFEAKVIAINPDIEEYKEILGIELKEDENGKYKAVEYFNVSEDGKDKKLDIDIWIEDVKNNNKYKFRFFLENKERWNKENTKKQYINNIGKCYFADDPNNLPTYFTARDYRVAYKGEEELYNFLSVWLGQLNLYSPKSKLELDWAKLMKGNTKDLKAEINGEYCTTFIALATVKTVTNQKGESNEYQNIYSKGFLPSYCLQLFNLVNYDDDAISRKLREKKNTELKIHEKFVAKVTGEYGCKDYYTLKELSEYNPDNNLVASNEVLAEDDGTF